MLLPTCAARLAGRLRGVRHFVCPSLVVLIATLLAPPGTARAQEVSDGELLLSDSAELQYSIPAVTSCDSCGHPLDACACGGVDWPRFGMYLKAGPSFQMGQSLFKQSTNVGYEIEFGGRELLLPTNRQVFFDFGGSYLSAFGTRPISNHLRRDRSSRPGGSKAG